MERLFNLDPQLIHDAILLALAVLLCSLSCPTCCLTQQREMLKKRQDKIKDDIDTANKDKEDAAALKARYDEKIRRIDKEAEEILSVARQKALQNEAKILEDAKEEAARIIARANAQIELERKAAADDMKRRWFRSLRSWLKRWLQARWIQNFRILWWMRP